MKITARRVISAVIYATIPTIAYLQYTGHTGAAWIPAILGVLLIMYRTQMPKLTYATVHPIKDPETGATEPDKDTSEVPGLR